MIGLDRTRVSGAQPTLHASSMDATQIGDGLTGSTGGAEPVALARGSCIGRYVVLEMLGAGGMGVVYAAYDPELDRKVAIKLLHRDIAAGDGTRGATRLLREAQAMARLSHPNVIAVHDVGTHDGQVFMAMEFVEGRTLGDELTAKPRGWKQLVQLYAAAGRGLAAAHRSGLVHRDFKPDNVMIDGEGRIRVLDFGLACSADAGAVPVDGATTSSLDLRLTATGAVMGTPAYMAPEQHLGQPADERSDQFSFCVALYEGVYRERPFAGDSLPALILEVTQGRVREPRPGVRVPTWLRKVLLRGLARDPAQRFPDMTALLAALERDPARRRWWTAAAVGATLLLAGAGLGAQHLLGARAQLCSGAEQQLVGVWDGPRREAVRAAFLAVDRPFVAAAWNAVSARLDEYAGAWTAMHGDACAATRIRGEQSEDLLDRRMSCLQRQRDRLRSLVDGLAAADASVVERAVDVVTGLPPVSQCGDLEALTSPVEQPADAETAAKVADLRRREDENHVLHQLGKTAAALERTQALLVESRALGFRPQLAETLLDLGQMQISAGAPKDAAATLEEATLTAQASRHDRTAALALVWIVGNLAMGQSRFEEAEKLAPWAQAAIDRVGGSDKLQAELELRLAVAANLQGRKDEAARRGAAALALAERVYGVDGLQYADFANNVGSMERNRQRYAEAEALYHRALHIWRVHLGDGHPKPGGVLTNLALMHMRLHRDAEAEQELRAALALYERSLPPDHPELAITLNGLAQLLSGQDRDAEAEAAATRALAIFQRKFGERHRNVAAVHTSIANTQVKQGHHDDALVHLEAALKIGGEIYGPEHPFVAKLITDIAAVHYDRKDYTKALAQYQRSLAMYEKTAPGDAGIIEPLTGVGRCQVELGAMKIARAPLLRALELASKDPAYTPGDLGAVRFPLARALWDTGERPKALETARAAREAWAAAPAKYPTGLAEVTAWLAARES